MIPATCRRFVLVMLGDSLTQGYGLARDQALPRQMQRLFDADGVRVEVRNRGVSGETSAEGLKRFDSAVAGGDGVVIQFGGNDMLRGRPPSLIRADLSAMIVRARARQLWVGLVGLKAPAIAGGVYREAFDRTFRELASDHNAPLYPFFFDGLVDPHTGLGRSEFFLDRVHPNARGIGVVATGLTKWLKRALPYATIAREA